MKVIRPAIRRIDIEHNGVVGPGLIEYDIQSVFFFGLLAWARPNRVRYHDGEIVRLEGFGATIITTAHLGWFRLEEA